MAPFDRADGLRPLFDLGGRIAQAREALGLSQEELAAAAGVSRSTIQRLEAGSSTQLANLVRVLDALGAAGDLDLLCADPDAARSARSPEPAGPDPGDRSWRWGGHE